MSDSENPFYTPPTEGEQPKQVEQPKKRTKIPFGYIPVNLNSLGKLDSPPTLHFRNYSMEEALSLSSANEETFLGTLVECLNDMVFEGFDCAYLNENELIEIMLTIYKAFWGKSLEGLKYYINPDLPEDKREAVENIGEARVDINTINTFSISKEFKEPFSIKIDDYTVKFKLSRIGYVLNAKEYIDKLYAEEDRKFSDVKSIVQKNSRLQKEQQEAIAPDLLAEYQKFTVERARMFIRAIECQQIEAINGTSFKGGPPITPGRLKAIQQVGLNYWREFRNIQDNQAAFGVNPEVKFFSEELNEPITRRLQFQPLDFLPNFELQNDSTVDISFGD